MAYYTFGDVLRHNDLTRNQLNRWVQAGLIRPQLAPGESLRRFTARNLVEAAVCDELRGFGLSEVFTARVMRALNGFWDAPETRIDERPDAPTFRECPILWIGFVRFTLPPDDELREELMVRLVDVATLTTFLTDTADDRDVAESGLAIPLHRLIRDLETKTGDRFDFTPQPVASTTPPTADTQQEELARLRADVDSITKTLAANIINAINAASEIAAHGQPISEDEQAAIRRAVTAALEGK